MSLKKWHEVYVDQDERNFFVGKDGKSGLVRSQWDFRSVSALAKESGLTVQRVEEIVDKYVKAGLIIMSPNKDDNYGYWQRVASHLGSDQPMSVAATDQADRVKKAKKP